MNREFGFFDKYVVPVLMFIVLVGGVWYLWQGDYPQGCVTILTIVYFYFQYLAQSTGFIPKWTLILMGIMTLLMVSAIVYQIVTGQYFGVFVSVLFIIGGLATMISYYKGDKK
ncbi:hypothetical protein Thu_178 [Bacillus phage Thurquoise]|nr:hypothetical protein Thu_178 [Bacillus phage Thurquoise]